MTKQAVLLLTLFFLLPVVAHAQTGCLDSPENPTAILGLVGSAAAGLCALRGRVFRRKR
jgi:XrtJ-associated TM-motif-TM protein